MTVVLGAGQGKKISALGNELTYKTVSGDSGGALFICEYQIVPGFQGPPPHIHSTMTEMFYVLAGQLSFRLGDDTADASPGSFVLISPGTLHSFSNPLQDAGRFLVICSPAGLEGYFDELPGVIAEHGYPPPPEVMRALGEKYDTIVPPPPAQPTG